MQRVALFVLLAVARARIIDNNCDGIVLHNINHEKDLLKSGLDSPYQLAIDYDTNTLFFSYSSHDYDVFKSAYLNLKTNEYHVISGIPGGFANAVDNKNHIVYLGGNDGIYTFDFETNEAKFLAAKDTNIWQLFYKNKLYYTVYPSESAYYYENGESKKVPQLIGTRAMLIAVDNNENIFFSNSSGLFLYETINEKQHFLGDYNPNGFTSDIDGNLYFSTPDGIFSIKGQQIDRLMTYENIYGLAIEGDNTLIYAAGDNIVRLKPTNKMCFTADRSAATYNDIDKNFL